MASYSNISAGNAGIFAQIAARLTEARERFARNRLRRHIFRQTMSELSALSTRELADLGLHRSMIRRVAWQEAQKR